VAAGMPFIEMEPRTNQLLVTRLLNQARNAEERCRTLFESANDTVTILSTDGVILEANQRWVEILKVPPDALVGRHIREFAAAGSETQNLAAFADALTGGEGRVTTTLVRADGIPILMEFSYRLVELDGRSVVFAIGRDVTEAVRAAQELAAAEEKYRSLIERIPDVVWTADEHGRVTFVTPNIENLLGFSVEETCGASVEARLEEIHPEDRTLLLDAWEGLLRDGKQFDIEYRQTTKDGRWVWLRNRGFATFERNGVHHAEGMISDITERRQLEAGLHVAQKMEVIGQLSAGIAHDFNNMLCAILANCHLLIDDLGKNDPRCSDAREIKEIAERAAALTRQLLAFSRRQVLAPTVLDLNTSVAGLQKVLQRLLGEAIELSMVRDPELGLIRADAGQIEQVIVNLAVNARDAMPDGGKLVFETAHVTLKEAEAARFSAHAGRYVTLAVSDTGVGMDEETKRQLFEPFFTTKGKGRGTGLGLSTCYGIVKQSGGWIEVASEPGKGAVFKVWLPSVAGAADLVTGRSPNQ
jgi:two-component system cell cycle sensor histidine kinase/response regulator CckA